MAPLRWLLSILLIATFATCRTDHSPSGPELNSIRPELDTLYFTFDTIDSGLALEFHARLASGDRIGRSEIVPVRVSSTGGDSMTVPLRSGLCTHPDIQGTFVCDQITVTVHDGRSVEELRPLFQRMYAQIAIRWRRYPLSATVHVFSHDVAGAVARASEHSATRSVQANTPAFLDTVPSIESQQVGIGAVPVDAGAMEDDRKWLNIAPGDRVTAEYTQPDGSILTTDVEIR